MSFLGQPSARAIVQMAGDSALYKGQSGDVRTWVQIVADVDYVGGDTRMSDRRFVCTFLVEDVSAPQKRDQIHFDSGRVFTLREPLPASDEFFHEWTVTPK